jgi:hypothetical protein
MNEQPTTKISRAAHWVHWFIFVYVIVELTLRLGITIFDPGAGDPALFTRLVRLVSYFTIESNFVVGLASAAIIFGPRVDGPWWRALRLTSLMGITVTGVVYALILAGDAHNTGLSVLTNAMLHYICPPMVLLAWLIVGPWPPFVWGDLLRAMVWPAAWVVYTLIHGAISDWYPYPFIDVITHGYGKVGVNIVFITLFALAIGSVVILLNGVRRRSVS